MSSFGEPKEFGVSEFHPNYMKWLRNDRDEYEARLRDAVQDAAERFVHVAEWRMAEILAAAEVTA